MTKFKVVNLIDKLFITTAIFLFIFAWINFYTRNLWLTFVLSLIFSFACVFLLFYFINKKQVKTNKSKSEIENINKFFLGFRLMTTTEQQNLFLNILKDKNIKLENNFLIYNENNKKIAIFFATEFETITENIFFNIVSKFRNVNIDEIKIVCLSFQPINTNILKGKTFTFVNKENLFKNYFESYNNFPNIEDINSSKLKFNFIDILNNFFTPHKAKSYFVCGLILIFSSIILPYHFYYIIFGSMFLLFAIICKIKKIVSR